MFFLLLSQPASDNAEDEIMKENEEANEVPLGKMLKQLKSQGTKGGKLKKNKSQRTKAESDVDILKMVREINLDNQGLSGKFESSNGHKHSPSGKIKAELEHQKVKKRKASAVASVPVPKRRRSTLPQTPLKAIKNSVDGSSPELKGKKSIPKEMFESSESDDLASSVKKRKRSTSEHKGKDSDMGNNGKKSEAKGSDEDSPLVSFSASVFF